MVVHKEDRFPITLSFPVQQKAAIYILVGGNREQRGKHLAEEIVKCIKFRLVALILGGNGFRADQPGERLGVIFVSGFLHSGFSLFLIKLLVYHRYSELSMDLRVSF